MNTSFDRIPDGKEEWLTPPELVRALGTFDLDPCAPRLSARPWQLAAQSYSLQDDGDGLALPWRGRVFCNPPYGRKTGDWLQKCADHGNAIALTFARTDSRWFHRQVFQRAHALLFVAGRLAFYHVTGKQGDSAGAPSVLIAYDQAGAACLSAVSTSREFTRAPIPGAFVQLHP